MEPPEKVLIVKDLRLIFQSVLVRVPEPLTEELIKTKHRSKPWREDLFLTQKSEHGWSQVVLRVGYQPDPILDTLLPLDYCT